MARSPRNRKRDDPKVRREQILDEAIRIIGQLGCHGFTVQGLAQQCGLSNAGLLYHFPAKDQLLVAVVEELQRREILAIAPLVERIEAEHKRSGASVATFLELIQTMAVRASTQPELARLYTVLQSESLDETHPAHAPFRARETAVLNLFTKLLAPYVADPASTARHLAALLDGLRFQWLRAQGQFDVVSEWRWAVTALVPALAGSRKQPQASRYRNAGRPVASRTTRRTDRQAVKRR